MFKTYLLYFYIFCDFYIFLHDRDTYNKILLTLFVCLNKHSIQKRYRKGCLNVKETFYIGNFYWKTSSEIASIKLVDNLG